jgi:acyl-CoA reductase-like NAD-dependent aldehyde dehydrogenase
MEVIKTIKLFINGQFTRTESGRSFQYLPEHLDKPVARLCLASRKDFRNAITAAQNAFSSWSARTAYNRSQIIYRLAEMAQARQKELSEALVTGLNLDNESALKEVQQAIDNLVYFAGFTDKYQQVIGSVNPINGPHHNFSTPESIGVTALIDLNDTMTFSNFMSHLASIIATGNTVVALMNPRVPHLLAPLSEILATSDIPAGVVNLLTGHYEELAQVIATHREVRALSFQSNDTKELFHIKQNAADNMKRVVPYRQGKPSLAYLKDYIEIKTIWHPIGT